MLVMYIWEKFWAQMWREGSHCLNMRLHFENRLKNRYTVESRYFEIGYLEFRDSRSVYLNQKYILIAFSNHNLAFEIFYKSKLPEVQINLNL